MAVKDKKLCSGRVLRLDKVGLGIIVSDASEAQIEEKEYPFTFDKIEGYKGESLKDLAKELGLSDGQAVKFTLDGDDLVREVTVEDRPQGKARVRFGFDQLFSIGGKVF